MSTGGSHARGRGWHNRASVLMRLWFSLFLVLPWLAAGADVTGAIAIRDARIVPVSGPAIPRGTVVVRNGLIEAVGASAAIPPDAWVMSGEGLTVYPGLIDALSTWGIPEQAAAPAATSRTGRSAPAQPQPAAAAAQPAEPRGPTNSHVRAADLIRTTDRRIEAARSAGFTTAVTFPTTGIFAGQGAVINLAGEKPGQMVVASPVAQYLTFSSGAPGEFPASLMGAFAHIRQILLDAEHYRRLHERYARNPVGFKRPDYDRALEAVLETKRMLVPASREIEVERALRLQAEFRNVDFILYGGHEGFRAAERLRAGGRPVLVNLRWPERSRESDPDREETLRTLELQERAPASPAALAKAGVKFAFYSGGSDRPRDLLRAVRRAIEAGLAPEAALRALTLSAAEIYGVADRLGSIDKGKIANLLIASGDIFQEKTQVKYVIIDGVKYEPSAETSEEASR